jgi:hypothetical protein
MADTSWLFLDRIPPSKAADLLPRLRIESLHSLNAKPQIVTYGHGSLIIPESGDDAPLTLFPLPYEKGTATILKCYDAYNTQPGSPVRSFHLKRGYMATLAQNADGTGDSRVYIAADSDIAPPHLPPALDGKVQFIRVFPWRWVCKKGIAGNIWQKLNVGWYYNWGIGKSASPDLDYVGITNSAGYLPLRHNWQKLGLNTLLGFNEPDNKLQSHMTTDQAIALWPQLLKTGLRLGSPAVTDGGEKWLYEFMDKADAAHLRVDFVAVHYYQAAYNPADAQGTAVQFYRFLLRIHNRTHRPLWITEFNNGANWTNHKPTFEQQRDTVAAFLDMLDKTPFVERYALYNWVEDERMVQRADGSLTPAGIVYRDDFSPIVDVQREQSENQQ